jgi:Protein of unknown function (DUF3311)
MSRQRIAGTAHRWLLLVPFVWQAGLAPFIDDVALRPFSLPFPMFWQMAGIVLTTIVIAVVLRLDRRRETAMASESSPSAQSADATSSRRTT